MRTKTIAMSIASLALLAGACGTTSSPAKPVPKTVWLLAYSHFGQVVSSPKVKTLFEKGTIYEPVTPKQVAAPHSIPTADFHSEALLASTLTPSS
jgi:hypothetical protein